MMPDKRLSPYPSHITDPLDIIKTRIEAETINNQK